MSPRAHSFLVATLPLHLYKLFLRRRDEPLAGFVETRVFPYQRTAARITDSIPFSVAELIYAVFILAVSAYLIRSVYLIVRREGKLKRSYTAFAVLLCAGLSASLAIDYSWGLCYYGDSFQVRADIETAPISTEQLKHVTLFFAEKANEYGALIKRDENGLFDESVDDIFDAAPTLYRNTLSEFPFLDGPEPQVKPMAFSLVMSVMNFTGFYFAPTGEANINVHSPRCMLPSTIAHEQAHQRGVAAEQEANFVAVLACLNSGNAVYGYSASLLAYIHLSNALYSADHDAWVEVYGVLSENIRSDLRKNSEYWNAFDTTIAKASESVYTGFLQSHGQEFGMKSYGACIDLLTAYYGENAEK